MGADKALLTVDGVPLAGRVASALRAVPSVGRILAIGRDTLPGVDVAACVPDEYPGAGPLGGLITALRHGETDAMLIVAADMLALVPALLEHIVEITTLEPATVPRWQGRPQPLCAVYTREVLPIAEALLRDDRRSLHALLDALPTVRWVDDDEIARFDPGGESFINVNDPQDLRAWQTRARASSGLESGEPGPR
jgi:molybdenum cofactor guanylyltransferase